MHNILNYKSKSRQMKSNSKHFIVPVVYTGMQVPKWASKTHGQHGCYLVMQDDGNLVIYNFSGKAVWASNTCQMGMWRHKSLLVSCSKINTGFPCYSRIDMYRHLEPRILNLQRKIPFLAINLGFLSYFVNVNKRICR